MAAQEFSSVSLEAEHVPETHRTLEADHTVTEQELPGQVNVYLVIDGARILFTQYKAGKVFDAFAARDAQAASAPQSQPQSAPAPAAEQPAAQPAEQSAPAEQSQV